MLSKLTDIYNHILDAQTQLRSLNNFVVHKFRHVWHIALNIIIMLTLVTRLIAVTNFKFAWSVLIYHSQYHSWYKITAYIHIHIHSVSITTPPSIFNLISYLTTLSIIDLLHYNTNDKIFQIFSFGMSNSVAYRNFGGNYNTVH